LQGDARILNLSVKYIAAHAARRSEQRAAILPASGGTAELAGASVFYQEHFERRGSSWADPSFTGN